MDGMAVNFFAPVKYTLKSWANGFKVSEFSLMMKISWTRTSAAAHAIITVQKFTCETARPIRLYTAPSRPPKPIREKPSAVGRCA
ncbi:hypothetical protein D3C71_837520 [compost metagenome]